MPITPEEANQREHEFLATVRGSAILWLLVADGGLANWSEEETLVVPVWSDEREARSCAVAGFAGYEPQRVELCAFLRDYLPRLEERQAWVAIRPTAGELAGSQIPAERLRSVLGDGGA